MANWGKEFPPLVSNRLNKIGEVTQEEKIQLKELEKLDSLLRAFFKGELDAQEVVKALKQLEEQGKQFLLKEAYIKLKGSFKWKELPIKFEERDNGMLSIQLREGEEDEHALVLEITDDNFDETVKSHSVLVVDCWAEWCAPCRMVAPVIEELAEEYQGKITFGKLNVDTNQSVATRYQIMSIPTILIFKNGQMVGQKVGAMPKKMLEDEITRLL